MKRRRKKHICLKCGKPATALPQTGIQECAFCHRYNATLIPALRG